MQLQGSADPSIDGNLVINTPNATVTNYVKVSGVIYIHGVASSTYNEEADDNNLEFNLQEGSGTANIIGDADTLTVTGSGDSLDVMVYGSVKTAEFNDSTSVTGGENIESAHITAEGCEFDEAPEKFTNTVDVTIGDEPVSPTPLGDINGDRVVDVGDAILILRYIVGLISEFPAEG